MCNINKVVVIGAGLMGKQIALNCAISGYETVLNDKFEEALQNADSWKNDYLQKRIQKGRITEEEGKNASERMTINVNLEEACKDADLVIEAIIEKEDNKKQLFAELDKLTKKDALLVSNSSFIPSSVVADQTNKPDKVANLHYFNPALVMKLVEVVQGPHTSDETAKALFDFAKNTGKEPILVKKEIDGFVANRILSKITQEALYLVEKGIVSPQEVDKAVEKGLNHPLGPFRLMDLVGIDTAYLARQRRYENSGDESDKPPKFMEEKYQKGEFGKKTGKGWYEY